MKTIKMIEANGALWAADDRSAKALKATGLEYSGGFLSLTVLSNHVAERGCKIKIVTGLEVAKARQK